MCYASGINPYAIPGDDLDPDAVDAAATAIENGGNGVRQAGADTVAAWRPISLHYEAPEAPQLFVVMDPVETKAREFGDDVVAVAAALRRFADDIRPIKAALAAVKRDARAFRSRIASNAEWEYDQGLVDENTRLVSRVNAQQVKLWEAERTCANAIRALYGAAPWTAADGSGSGLEYGADALGTDAEMPWGSEVARKDHCPKAAGVQVKRFVWDGVIVDGLWGTVTGLGMLVGVDDWSWSWETMKTSWQGLGSLIGYDMTTGEWSPGTAGDAWLGLGKGIIAYDMWAEDPARALGGAGFNIATILIPAGAAVAGTKGAATAAGTTGRVARALTTGARIVDLTDPVALMINGGRIVLPKVGDALSSLRLVTEGLDTYLRLPDFSAPSLDARLADDALRGLDDVGDSVPTVRDPDVTPDRAEVPAPVREAVGPDGRPAPGGVANGADDLLDPGTVREPGAPDGSPGTDAPTGGSSGADGSRPGGSDGSSGGSGSGGSGGSGPDGPATGGPAAGGAGDGSGPGGPVDPVDPTPGGGSGGGPGDGPDRIAIDASGNPHVVNTSDALVSAQGSFSEVLPRVLEDHGLTRAQFQDLLQTPVGDLTRTQVDTLVSIRDAMPGVDVDTVLQKVITPQQALDVLGPAAGEFMEPGLLTRAGGLSPSALTEVGGFVSRAADMAGATPAQIYHQLGLTYSGSPFLPDGESMFALRYRGGDAIPLAGGPAALPGVPDGTIRALSAMPDSIYQIADPIARRAAMQTWIDTHAPGASFDAARALDPDNPFRGNGFSGESSAYSPELSYGPTKVEIPEGAELWRVRPDGSQVLAAVYREDAWHHIVEQPGSGPDLGESSTSSSPSPDGVTDPDGAPRSLSESSPMAEDAVRGAPRWEDSLKVALDAQELTHDAFLELIDRPLHRLSADEVHTLLEIREALPPISPEDVVQKILPPEQVKNMLGHDVFASLTEPEVHRLLEEAATWVETDGPLAGQPAVKMHLDPTAVGGFVARLADISGLTTSELFHSLGLGYRHSTFAPDQAMFAVRFQAGDLPGVIVDRAEPRFRPIRGNEPLEVMRDAMDQPALDGSARSRFDEIMGIVDETDRRQAWLDLAAQSNRDYSMGQALDGANPHRGNGFGGTGDHTAPEFTFGQSSTPIPDGAEMWRIDPDGSSRVVAVFDAETESWQSIV